MTKVVNKKDEDFDVYIGRGSPWGNPFSSKEGTKAEIVCSSRAEAIAMYEKWILGLVDVPGLRPPEIGYIRKALTDRVLGCFCKPRACHGDILAKICSWEESEVEANTLALRTKYELESNLGDLF